MNARGKTAAQGQAARRKNYAAIHAFPLPIRTHPIPAFHPTNPLAVLQLAYYLLSELFFSRKSSHPAQFWGYYSALTRSIHVTDPASARALWEHGFFGKGSLSRSEPEWLEREKRRLGLYEEDSRARTAAEVTQKRREERKEEKRLRARREREELEERLKAEGKLDTISFETNPTTISQSDSQNAAADQKPQIATNWNGRSQLSVPDYLGPQKKVRESIPSFPIPSGSGGAVSIEDQEHLQLTPEEAFFLAYGLGVLQIHPHPKAYSKSRSWLGCFEPERSHGLSTHQLLSLLRHDSTFPSTPLNRGPVADDPFLLKYAAYHHYRSLGWVVRPGIKFSVDLLLYNRGPAFAHAEFGIIILPSYTAPRWASAQESKPDSQACDETREHQKWRERGEWWWLHAANRVQNQVLKTLVLAYVEVPCLDDDKMDLLSRSDIGQLLSQYKVNEFVVKRWSPKRNRD